MHQLSYHEHNPQTGYPDIQSHSTGSAQLFGRNVINYQTLTIKAHSITPQYFQSHTPQIQLIYTRIDTSGLIDFKQAISSHSSNIEKLEKEIESDDFLREFFSITKKIEHVPTPKQIKEQYYTR